jgi:hypothetical protein
LLPFLISVSGLLTLFVVVYVHNTWRRLEKCDEVSKELRSQVFSNAEPTRYAPGSEERTKENREDSR